MSRDGVTQRKKLFAGLYFRAMLLTICTNCSAQFKVQPEQLNVRQGRVMCGRCRQVFNAFQSLTRVEDSINAPFVNMQEVAAAAVEPVTTAPTPDTLETFFAAETSGESLPANVDENRADAAPELVADALFLREEPLALPAAFSASPSLQRTTLVPDSPSQIVVRSSTLPAPIDEDKTQENAAAPAPVTAVNEVSLEPAIDLSGEGNRLLIEPAIYRGAPELSSRGWRLGVFVLFVGLVAQVAYAFRTPLVATFPQLRPAVSQVCEFAGCVLSWGRDESVLKIEASELIESPGKPGRILLTAVLVNHGKTKQDLPSLELKLTDNANQVVVSRLFNPGDYLGRAIAKDEGLMPNTELYVNLNLELINKPLASGYGLVVFYP